MDWTASTWWWIATAALVAAELATGTFYLLMLAVGTAASALAAHAGLGWNAQLIVGSAIKLLTDANALLDTWFGRFDLGRAYFAAGAFVQADAEFDLCITRRGEALSLVDEGPTYGWFPVVYYYQGRVREEMKTAAYADAYRQYLKMRGTSADDPLVRDVRKRVSN